MEGVRVGQAGRNQGPDVYYSRGQGLGDLLELRPSTFLPHLPPTPNRNWCPRGQRKEAFGKEYLGTSGLAQARVLYQTVNKSCPHPEAPHSGPSCLLCGPWLIAILSPNRNEGCPGLHLLMRTETRAWVPPHPFSLGKPMLRIHLLTTSLGARTGTLSMWKKERWDRMAGDQTQTTTDLTRSQSCRGSSLLCLCQGTCY